MSFLQSIFLGIVQGLTEFLPVSSSGHLAIMQNIFKIDTGSSILYDVLLHFGTLIVVFYLYRKEIGRLILEFFGMVRDLFDNLKIRREKLSQLRYRRSAVVFLLKNLGFPVDFKGKLL